MTFPRLLVPLSCILLATGCPGDDSPTTGSDESSSSGTTGDPTGGPTTDPDTSTGGESSTGMGTTTDSTTSEVDSTGTTAGTDSDSSDSSGSESTEGGVDMDMDGVPEGVDCNDDDPLVYPGAPERCNGEDDDCEPMTGEDGVISVDGYGSFATVGGAIAASMPGSEIRICPGTYVETVTIDHDLTMVSQDGAAVTILDGNDAGPTVSVTAGTVSLTGLTLTGGSSVGLGGGLSITGTDPVTVTDCEITANQSSDGAGIYTYIGAQLSVEQTSVSGNLGEIGGGLMFQGTQLSISGSSFVDNIASELGGGMVIFGTPTVQLDTTLITDNQSLAGGGLAVEGSSFELVDCTLERNEGIDGGGGMFLFFGFPGTVTSTNSSWGAGMDDNSPDDVFVGGTGAFTGYGAGASFTCTSAGCM